MTLTTGSWDPATPAGVAAILADCEAPWRIAGGYAIEFAVGRALRPHDNIDVLMLRRDQWKARAALSGWELWVADPSGTLRPWLPSEWLPEGVHDVWCRRVPDGPWQLQIMLDESEGGQWLSRRNPDVRRPIEALGGVSPGGIPYLAPEIQLYYKAKQPRPKDETDLAAVLPRLDASRRLWLGEAIRRTYGGGQAGLPLVAPSD